MATSAATPRARAGSREVVEEPLVAVLERPDERGLAALDGLAPMRTKASAGTTASATPIDARIASA